MYVYSWFHNNYVSNENFDTTNISCELKCENPDIFAVVFRDKD